VGDRGQQTYPISIRLEAYDRTGLLSEVSQVVAENKVNILAATSTSRPTTRRLRATIEVASVAQLAKVMSRLEQLKDVISVQRDTN
jgi:(p)ppGpp synthase/HD superfamily hydrolase